MKKVKSFQASDGQLFLDGGKLVTHELTQVIAKVPPCENRDSIIAEALVKNHAVLFDALKLLRPPGKKKAKAATAQPSAAVKGK